MKITPMFSSNDRVDRCNAGTKFLFLLVLLGALVHLPAAPLRTGFDYQGRLADGSDLANGLFQFRFTLFDVATGGSPVAGPVTNTPVNVTNGLFNTVIDFGSKVFDGTQLWLEIAVRPAGALDDFVPLAPRQLILPVPSSLYAATAGTVATGAVGPDSLAANSVTAVKIAPGQVLRSLNGLTDDVELAVEGDLVLRRERNQLILVATSNCFAYTNCYWNLYGNGNITAGVHFLGTVAGELDPLEMRVNNITAARIFPTAGTPNLVGGSGANVANGVGIQIGGGGTGGSAHLALSDYASIDGGRGHRILTMSPHATIGGGLSHLVDAGTPFATIAGGHTNVILNGALAATVSGGESNQVQGASVGATIGGGRQNGVAGGVPLATVAGGERNRIETGAAGAVISGGVSNAIQSSAVQAVIGGGSSNVVARSSTFATLAGGNRQLIDVTSPAATIGGGDRNAIGQRSTNGVISGGARNVIGHDAPSSVVGGGEGNLIRNAATNATIGGGRGNEVFFSAPYAVIPGGDRAVATNYNQYAFASGSFTQPGDAQHSQYVLRGQTLGFVPGELFLDGAAREIVLRPNTTLVFDIIVTARNGAGDSAGYQVRGVIEHTIAGLAFVGVPSVGTLGEDIAGWSLSVQADLADNALILVASGSGNTPVYWVAHVRTVEVRL